MRLGEVDPPARARQDGRRRGRPLSLGADHLGHAAVQRLVEVPSRAGSLEPPRRSGRGRWTVDSTWRKNSPVPTNSCHRARYLAAQQRPVAPSPSRPHWSRRREPTGPALQCPPCGDLSGGGVDEGLDARVQRVEGAGEGLADDEGPRARRRQPSADSHEVRSARPRPAAACRRQRLRLGDGEDRCGAETLLLEHRSRCSRITGIEAPRHPVEEHGDRSPRSDACRSSSHGTASAYRAAVVTKSQRSAAPRSWQACSRFPRTTESMSGASSSARPGGRVDDVTNAVVAWPSTAGTAAGAGESSAGCGRREPALVVGMMDQDRERVVGRSTPGGALTRLDEGVDQGGLARSGRATTTAKGRFEASRGRM